MFETLSLSVEQSGARPGRMSRLGSGRLARPVHTLRGRSSTLRVRYPRSTRLHPYARARVFAVSGARSGGAACDPGRVNDRNRAARTFIGSPGSEKCCQALDREQASPFVRGIGRVLRRFLGQRTHSRVVLGPILPASLGLIACMRALLAPSVPSRFSGR